MKDRFHKPLTNIEKLNKVSMENKIIVSPPNTSNNLLYEKYDRNKFSITAFNPFGRTAKMVVKDIALIPLSFLTYKLLTPLHPIVRTIRDDETKFHRKPTKIFKPKKGIV